MFEYSDTLSGYVANFNKETDTFTVKTSDREVMVKLTGNTFAKMLRNLGEPYYDCTPQMRSMLVDGQYISTYGIFYMEGSGRVYEAKEINFTSKKLDTYRFEEGNWWINQAESICNFFVKAQFGNVAQGEQEIDYRNYRTNITLTGERGKDFRQETDTISRMIYGMASAYMLTGEDVFLETAEKGCKYLQDHMRFYDVDEKIVYWYHGIDIKGDREHKVFASEFGDDYEAIPMYEQIYALAGLTQTYRLNGDLSVFNDIKLTIELFDKFFIDNEKEGYFSHIDPIMLDPRSDSLGQNKARKNWNSVGDHAPAYLINLWLATYDEKYKKFLEYTADCIEKYFPDYDNSPFVQERFFEDWSHDKRWGWQQDNAVVGHNLKIAWNLMRIFNEIPKDEYVELAEKIGAVMPKTGMDVQRGGWYDVVARTLKEGEDIHRFVWHDRKAWWQQEQGILAYQLLYGVLQNPEYLKLARESAAFYNTYFLDHSDGAVYFNVLANGIPFLMGTERQKGSHSMSAYHSVELAFLSTIYINLLHTKTPVDLYFKPMPDGFEDGVLRVQPDILPKGAAKISGVWIDGEPWDKFDADNFTVELPRLDHRPKIKVTVTPV